MMTPENLKNCYEIYIDLVKGFNILDKTVGLHFIYTVY